MMENASLVDVCGICQEEMEDTGKTTKTSCGHVFHVVCFDTVVMMQRRTDKKNENVWVCCPICRSSLQLSKMKEYQYMDLLPVPKEKDVYDPTSGTMSTEREDLVGYVARNCVGKYHVQDVLFDLALYIRGSKALAFAPLSELVECVHKLRDMKEECRSRGAYGPLAVHPEWRLAIAIWAERQLQFCGRDFKFPMEPAHHAPAPMVSITSDVQVSIWLFVFAK